MSRPWNKAKSLRYILVTATLMALAATGLANIALADDNLTDSWSPRDKRIFESNFNLRPAIQSENTYTVVDLDTGRIIGRALWDSIRRRFTLYDTKRKYAGFIQATMAEPQASLIYKQYLAYDEKNNYQGVIIKDVGGMPLPALKPPSLPQMVGEPLPMSLGRELRGQWQIFRMGNVAIEDVPEPEPRVLPWYIEEILDGN